MKKCNPGYYAGTSTPIYIPLGNGKQMGWTSDGTPCSFKSNVSTSSGYSNGWTGASSSNYNSAIRNLDKSLTTLPESTPYVRPEFVPYTPPVKSFLEEPKYVIPITQSNTSIVSGNSEKANDLNQFLRTKYIPQDVIGRSGNTNKIYSGTHSDETMKVTNFIQTQSYNKGWGSSALYHGPGGIEGSYRATVINLAYTDMYDLDLCNLGVLLRDYNLELDSILLQGNKLTAKHIPELISGITSVRHQTICEYVGRSKVFKEWHGHLTVQHVKYLNISNNQIGDEGASIFAEAIKTGRFTHLKSLNLADNNITDIGAKVLADSLTTGNYNSKTLRLEGNKITDEGQDPLINALKNETVQDVIITAITLYEKYQLNVSGNKEKQRSILENQLERAKAHGIDVDNVVVDKTAWEWIKNKYQLYKGLSVGWTKCFISYDDIESFAGERLLAKASKRLSWANDVKDGVLCYFEAESEALLTEPGVRDIKYQLLEVQETPELIGNIEAWYDFLPL